MFPEAYSIAARCSAQRGGNLDLPAIHLLDHFCTTTLIKDRYEIQHQEHLWEIDVFHGVLEGLIVAEIELQSEDESFEIPIWVDREVTEDRRYYNSNLIRMKRLEF